MLAFLGESILVAGFHGVGVEGREDRIVILLDLRFLRTILGVMIIGAVLQPLMIELRLELSFGYVRVIVSHFMMYLIAMLILA